MTAKIQAFSLACGRRILTCLESGCVHYVRAAWLLAAIFALCVVGLLAIACGLSFIFTLLQLADWLTGSAVLPLLLAGTPLEAHLQALRYLDAGLGLCVLAVVVQSATSRRDFTGPEAA
ncbi:hypothetical protein G3A43_09425 [Paraburkholderia aspalathi]|nr:hypothetical protein [Paraburkholderia aspalathi]MBK3780446.1 hypothetical protein [Paraburkholderia aspalathi]